MAALPLYDSTKRFFSQQLPRILDTQRTNLALLVSAAAHAQSCHLNDLARALAVPTKQTSKVQRIRRTLDNERITQQKHYQPIVFKALGGLKGQSVNVALDSVLLRDRQNVLVASACFKRRAIPLRWTALEHIGSTDAATQKTLLEQAFAALPQGVRVTLHGDGEFCTTELFAWARSQGWNAMLGLRSVTKVYRTQQCDKKPESIAELADETGRVYLTDVYVTDGRYGPVNVTIWWEGEAEEGDKIRAVMTNLRATETTGKRERRRMWIETLFS